MVILNVYYIYVPSYLDVIAKNTMERVLKSTALPWCILVLYKYLVCKNKNRLSNASEFSCSINSFHAYRLENVQFSKSLTSSLTIHHCTFSFITLLMHPQLNCLQYPAVRSWILFWLWNFLFRNDLTKQQFSFTLKKKN